MRAHNFNSEKLKVNDQRGNPIEIAAAVVWRVDDTARASFDVEDYEAYVLIQAESALRHLASQLRLRQLRRPSRRAEVTLRSGTEEVIASARASCRSASSRRASSSSTRKLTHLAYAPEIAGAMLRRQQAEAVIAARKKIVHGAVGMVEMALNGLTERGLVQLDDERRAAMVSQPAGRAVLRPRGTAGGQRRNALHLTRPAWSETRRWRAPTRRRSCCASIRPSGRDRARWRRQELRSVNGQIECLLREALTRRGRTVSTTSRTNARRPRKEE